jgi:hypothetical protein
MHDALKRVFNNSHGMPLGSSLLIKRSKTGTLDLSLTPLYPGMCTLNYFYQFTDKHQTGTNSQHSLA